MKVFSTRIRPSGVLMPPGGVSLVAISEPSDDCLSVADDSYKATILEKIKPSQL